MKFQTQILLAAVCAGDPGPVEIDDSDLDFGTTDVPSNGSEWNALLKEQTYLAGGYACIRNGQAYATPQVILMADGTAKAAVTSATVSSFVYGTTTAEAGTAILNETSGNSGNFPNGDTLDWGTANSNYDPATIWQQCCSSANDAMDQPSKAGAVLAGCSSIINKDADAGANDGTYDGGDTTYQLSGRVAINFGAVTAVDAASADPLTEVDNDFILGALGQLSDNGVETDNFCTEVYHAGNDDAHYFETTSATADVDLKNLASYKTKCTWQFAATADTLIKFTIKASESSLLVLQWIEWSAEDDADANGPAKVQSDLLTDFNTAAYALKDATEESRIWWISPFLSTVATGTNISGDWSGEHWYRSNAADTTHPEGSIGFLDVYTNNGAGDVAPVFKTENVDSSVYFSQVASAQAIYDAVDSLQSSYDTALDKYNTAVKDYNTALEETPDEASLDDIPDRPSPPTKAGAYYGITLHFETDADFTDDSIVDGSGSLVAERAVLTGAADAWEDSWRYGYSFAYSDDTDAASMTSSLGGGHTFGVLGQEYSATAEAHRMKTDASPTDYLNWMQISVFPSDTTFDTYTSGQKTTLTVSAAAMGTFEAPEANSVSAGSFEDITGASALVASTMALAALTYTLY